MECIWHHISRSEVAVKGESSRASKKQLVGNQRFILVLVAHHTTQDALVLDVHYFLKAWELYIMLYYVGVLFCILQCSEWLEWEHLKQDNKY